MKSSLTSATNNEFGIHPKSVSVAARAIPSSACVSRASSLLKAVADPTRLRMLVALSKTELCVYDLALVTNMSESAVSHQLRVLRQERLVTFRKEGRIAYYQLLDDHVTELISSAIEHAQE